MANFRCSLNQIMRILALNIQVFFLNKTHRQRVARGNKKTDKPQTPAKGAMIKAGIKLVKTRYIIIKLLKVNSLT